MNRFWKIVHEDSGTTTAEYSVVITLIVAALVLASDGVRLAANSTFNRTAGMFGALAYESAANVDHDSAVDNQDPAFTTVRVPIAAIPPTHALAWGVLLVAIAIVGHARYRQRRALLSVSEIHTVAEPIAEVPSNPNFHKRQEIQRVLLRHFDEVLHSRIEVRHVMSRTARTIPPTALVSDLQEIMESEGFHHLLVLEKNKLVGVISDRDVHVRRGKLARHVMTVQPLTVSPGTQVDQAISIMLHRRISCLPIVEQGQVVGVLTVTDMLMTLQCLMKLLKRSASGEEPVDCAPSRTISELCTDFMKR